MSEVENIAIEAKKSKDDIILLSTMEKNNILMEIAKSIVDNADYILEQNKMDLDNAVKNGMTKSMQDRLLLTKDRLQGMSDSVVEIAKSKDPIGDVFEINNRPNGLKIGRMCVPLGVIAIIFEARPNVTSDVIALCLKTSNAIILRGGKEAINSNKAIVKVIKEAAIKAGLPKGAINLVTDTSRKSANELMTLDKHIDLLIPRGGASLINTVVQNATVPTIQTGVGNCHIFVEKTGDVEMAKNIIVNAKTSRPSVCNAAETLVLDKGLGEEKMKDILLHLQENGVELHGDNASRKLVPSIISATQEDYLYEYLDKKMAVKIVDGFNEGVNHIKTYSTSHSECIITNDYSLSQKFLQIIDAAAVYVNASTRFTDGGAFGFGAELGISTQKLHVRGPMGIMALTSQKYVIYGNGQVR